MIGWGEERDNDEGMMMGWDGGVGWWRDDGVGGWDDGLG